MQDKEQPHVVKQDGEVELNKVDNAIDRMSDDRKDHILQSFDGFKSYLTKRMELAEKIGLNEEQLAKIAERVGNYLSDNEEPRNVEEKLLMELWKAGDEEQRHKLAHMLVRLVQQ